MKKFGVFISLFFILVGYPLSAQLTPVVDAALVKLMSDSIFEQALYYAQSIAQMVDNVKNTYNQFQLMVEAEKRALRNLKGVLEVSSWEEFMKWHNRQLYLERETEARFMNMGVKIGSKTYTLESIEGIPDALRENFGDGYWGDFTEEQRREMYINLGLAPSNYAYIQTWKQREDRLARRILTAPERIAEENQEAAERNSDLIRRYTEEDETLTENQIMKNMQVTLSNLEMAARDQALRDAEYYEYVMARDKLSAAPPNPVLVDRASYEADYWEPITAGRGRDEWE
jgi:hypothetical protein